MTVLDHRYVGLRDAELRSNFGLRSAALNLLAHFGKLFVAQLLARVVVLSAFADHVCHILGIGSEPEVIWIDAKRHVARVAHARAIRNFSLVNHVGRAVSKIRLAAVLNLTVVPVVLPRVNDASGLLWRASLSKSGFQRFQQWWDLCKFSPRAFSTTELSPPNDRWGSGERERVSTLLTSEVRGCHGALDYTTHERFNDMTHRNALGVA